MDSESTLTMNFDKKLFDILKNVENISDINLSLFDFFSKYPTKETIRCPDGTIINISAREPAVDIFNNVLPLKDGIPQGEEATRITVKNIKSDITITSPPGVKNTCLITRYGSHVFLSNSIRQENIYHIERYTGLGEHIVYNKSTCFFEKFGCDDSYVKKLICPDYNTSIPCCDKHKSIGLEIININMVGINDIKLFITNDIILHYGLKYNNIKKTNLLRKIKITLELAEKGRLLNHQLSPDFELHGIHYYNQTVDNNNEYGWALFYSASNNRVAHIYLNEITTDIEVKKTIELFAFETLKAKHYNDLLLIKNFLKYKKQCQFTQLDKIIKKPFLLDITKIVSDL